jgi:hypothetical protein
MIVRSLILAAVLLAAWVLVGRWERRRGSQVEGVAPGVTMFTTDDCRICPLAIETLTDAGVPVHIMSATHPLAEALSVRSVPTLVVADTSGHVTFRRSGRSVVTDVRSIAAALAAVVAT